MELSRRALTAGAAAGVLAACSRGGVDSPTPTTTAPTGPQASREASRTPESKPPRVEVDHRYHFDNMFIFASPQDRVNRATVEAVACRPVTFGARLVPVTVLPPVLEAHVRGPVWVGPGGPWDPEVLQPSDRVVDRWTVMHRGGGTVITAQSDTRWSSLLTVAGGHGAIVGLPVPQMRRDVRWLPETSHLAVLQGYTEACIAQLRRLGASGYYFSTEMPLSSSSAWAPVRAVYRMQAQAVRAMHPQALTVVAPYFQKGQSPSSAATVAATLPATVVAPQDGLGTGTAALVRSGGLRTSHEYFKALAAAVPNLWATIECMSPGGGTPSTRGITTEARIRSQLDAVQGLAKQALGYMWGHEVAGLQDVANREVFTRGTYWRHRR